MIETGGHMALLTEPASAHRTTSKGNAAVPWVVACVLIVVIGVLGGALLLRGSDDERPANDRASDAENPPPADSASSSAAPSQAPSNTNRDERPSRKPANIADLTRPIVATTAPPSNDTQGRVVNYEAKNMIDGEPTTAWRMDGDGTGEDIIFDFGEEVVLNELGLINGYAKDEGGYDAYSANRRIVHVQWTLDDGSVYDQALIDGERGMQTMEIPATTTATARLTIVDVTKPAMGDARRNFTAMSEVLLLGTPTS